MHAEDSNFHAIWMFYIIISHIQNISKLWSSRKTIIAFAIHFSYIIRAPSWKILKTLSTKHIDILLTSEEKSNKKKVVKINNFFFKPLTKQRQIFNKLFGAMKFISDVTFSFFSWINIFVCMFILQKKKLKLFD